MRISWSGLLVLLAVAVPVIVQLRTVLSYLGIEPPVEYFALFGILVLVAIVGWAFVPTRWLPLKGRTRNGS